MKKRLLNSESNVRERERDIGWVWEWLAVGWVYNVRKVKRMDWLFAIVLPDERLEEVWK